jgi:hypothetical protein
MAAAEASRETTMAYAVKRASQEDIARRAARRRTFRRVKRVDFLVAAALLVLLLLGWAVDFAHSERWPGSHLLTASRSPHA